MYIRIQDDSIRYRLSRLEADQLIKEQKIQDALILSPAKKLRYSITLTDEKNNFEFQEQNNGLYLYINTNAFKSELKDRPSKTGILFTQSVGDKQITLSLEIDLKRK